VIPMPERLPYKTRIAGRFDFQAKQPDKPRFCSKQRRTCTANLRPLNARPAVAPLPDRLWPRCLNSTVPAQVGTPCSNAVAAITRSGRSGTASRGTSIIFHRNPFVERDAPQNGRLIQSRATQIGKRAARDAALFHQGCTISTIVIAATGCSRPSSACVQNEVRGQGISLA
jgi:hypothetical protein